MIPRPIMDKEFNPPLAAKPIELYVFIDPTCNECFALQPILRKLQIDYGRYITLRLILRTSLPTMNLTNESTDTHDESVDKSHASFPALGIKSAEFQGKRAGFKFVSKLFEYAKLKSKNVYSLSVLTEIAEQLSLDVDEFLRDFMSHNVLRSLQIDLYMAREMEVEAAPTFVFFNENIEDEGLKVSGLYSYEIYEQILEELIGYKIFPETPPTLNELFNQFDTWTTKEIAEIYRTSESFADRELKKRLLQRQVERVDCHDTILWRRKAQL